MRVACHGNRARRRGGRGVSETARLRVATMNLACGAAAQRRFVQLGMLQQACATIDELRDNELVAALAVELDALRAGSDDFMHERESAPRDFLFSDALEEEGWRRARRLARTCFTALRDEPPAGGWPANQAVGFAEGRT